MPLKEWQRTLQNVGVSVLVQVSFACTSKDHRVWTKYVRFGDTFSKFLVDLDTFFQYSSLHHILHKNTWNSIKQTGRVLLQRLLQGLEVASRLRHLFSIEQNVSIGADCLRPVLFRKDSRMVVEEKCEMILDEVLSRTLENGFASIL